jgi:predicted oxidoreductase
MISVSIERDMYSDGCLSCHGICPCCLQVVATIETRRMNTRYEDENSNWITSCLECFLESEDYWKERWDEYYSGCL